jgi:hypothetical protein
MTLTRNTAVGVSVMVNQESDKDHCREQPSGTKIDLCPDDVAPRITNRESPPDGCRPALRMLRFGVPCVP